MQQEIKSPKSVLLKDIDDFDLERIDSVNSRPEKLPDSRGKTGRHSAKLMSRMLDLRHVLGFLNQSEWINTMNIGIIM
jgi:hypothetical protein